MNSTISIIIQIAFVPLLSPLFIGVIRKVKARFQNRQGASIVQPYRDLRKLFHKDEIISEDASWIFRFAPYLIFATTIVIAAGIPIATQLNSMLFSGDMLVIVYLIALATFFLALAGMDAASPFGGFGSSREMSLAAITEGSLIFSLLTTAFVAGTTHVESIKDILSTIPLTSYAPIAVACVGFFIALLAENARYPFDNPATHLELTMVHEAMILEYSGKRLALMEWASANKLLIFIVLAANLFFPWDIVVADTTGGLIVNIGFTIVKAFIIAGAVAVVEASMPKLRYFRLFDLLFTSFFVSAIAVLIAIF